MRKRDGGEEEETVQGGNDIVKRRTRYTLPELLENIRVLLRDGGAQCLSESPTCVYVVPDRRGRKSILPAGVFQLHWVCDCIHWVFICGNQDIVRRYGTCTFPAICML